MIDKIIDRCIRTLNSDSDMTVFEGSRVLITGGAGFIGSWLCDALTDGGASVTCLDNLSTGKMENIDHLIGKKNFAFRRRDVAREWSLRSRHELVLHLASRAAPEDYQQHPIETLAANADGTRNALEYARRHDSCLLYASSSEVYGDAEIIPTPEIYWGKVNPIGPRSCYDEGKRFGEALCMAYLKTYGLDVRIVRLFNSYGPRIRADGEYARAIPRFITQALKNRDITVYGDGRQTRAFTFITDTVRGMLLALSSRKAAGKVINIGSHRETSIINLAQTIRDLAHSKSRITKMPLPKDDPRRRCPDVRIAKSLLGWEAHVDLRDGLQATIEWFSNHL